jgi:SOS regulatory protein LexA
LVYAKSYPQPFIAGLERLFYTQQMARDLRKIDAGHREEMQKQGALHRQKLANFYRAHRRMPSYAELMKLWDYRTKSAVHYALQKLILDGIVSRDRSGKLIPRNIFGEISVLGLVEAGFPSAAEEELVDTMSLDEYLIANKEATFMLRVKGDSMIDAGIMEGDLVLVERGLQPKVGQIVIAQVDGEYTMKFYRKRGDQIYLMPANKKYKPIVPKETLRIEAIVTAVIRKY